VLRLGRRTRAEISGFELRPQGILTERESEIVALVAQGLPNKVVARRLGIREGTVKLHLHNIYRKLSIESRFQLVAGRNHK
jgi:two-component system, NarL family, nitrate/nitrite response regulator NarL